MAPTRSLFLSLGVYNGVAALNSSGPLIMNRTRSKIRTLLHSSRPIPFCNVKGRIPLCVRPIARPIWTCTADGARRVRIHASDVRPEIEKRTGSERARVFMVAGREYHKRMNHVTYCRAAQRPDAAGCAARRVSLAWPATDSHGRVKTGASRGESKRNPFNSSSFS